MADLSDITVVRSLLARHGFRFSKALGQNFLIDPTVCPRMAELCLADDNTGVLEIGPGIGVLTRELAARAKRVVCVELDDRLLPVLGETLADCENVQVVHGDILKLDLASLLAEQFSGMRIVVCANLPYYITTPVILRLLEQGEAIEAITVMVQKEVAQRLCAAPGSKLAGAVTVCVDYYAKAEFLFGVPRSSFLPQPQVDSAVIRLARRKEPPVQVDDPAAFFRLVKAAFAQRRKTALNSISSTLSLPKETVAGALSACGLPAAVRSETLSTEELAALCRALM